MFRYILICTLVFQYVWTVPVQQQSDAVAAPILILTPQAQVRLESIPATYIHHLSPFARIAGPHEETIVYVPAGSVAPVAPIVPGTSVNVARSNAVESPQLVEAIGGKQFGNITQQIENISSSIQQGISMYPQFSEAATAAAEAASAAAASGAGLWPSFFPPNRVEKPHLEAKPESQPILQAPLADARHLYVLPAATPHIIDFVNGPYLITPISSVRARSLENPESAPIVAVPLPAANKPEALPLLTADRISASELFEPEKKTEFGRFLEANAPKKEELLLPQQQQQLQPEPQSQQQPLADALNAFEDKSAENAKPQADATLIATPQLKSHVAVDLVPEKAAVVAANELPVRKS